MSTRQPRHTRPKKLNAKQNVQIFREDQVEALLDYDQLRNNIETGVEKAEESEYHLQQAIKAAQAAKADAQKFKDAYIPTPPTISSDIQYDVLYPRKFTEPATYIRSSDTVEDCAGVAYCMDEEDEAALKVLNAKLPDGAASCSEDQFEMVMNFFEESAKKLQPYASVDGSPVLSLEELEDQYDETLEPIPDDARAFAKVVYEHWHSRRMATINHQLTPQVKGETHQESDDADPYVCFRRRELRQIRKTRNRDAQSAEKLRKLRLELEQARNLLQLVHRREQMRSEQLQLDRQLFEQRLLFKEIKRKLAIKADDELLLNVKKPKLPLVGSPNPQGLGQQFRMPPGAAGPENGLRTLEDARADKLRSIENEININIDKHIRWNEGFIDKTKAPLTPESLTEVVDDSGQYREAMPATYLPTPPASISEDESHPVDNQDVEIKDISRSSTPFRYASPVEDESMTMPSFRRRIGRGGRMVIDRRPARRKDRTELDDKFRFDSDDDDIEDVDDTFDAPFARMHQRAYLYSKPASEQQAQTLRRLTNEGLANGQPSVPVLQVTAAS